ncbi:hypothetical protein B0I37DRAFT_164623 [Chaetomium sp. MPI-CAGE-AT-0009]|nr:hypothetical protein B0I37DRAFT_164623 [Chaetomium sp. MPI-CAGE-AT-0009]
MARSANTPTQPSPLPPPPSSLSSPPAQPQPPRPIPHPPPPPPPSPRNPRTNPPRHDPRPNNPPRPPPPPPHPQPTTPPTLPPPRPHRAPHPGNQQPRLPSRAGRTGPLAGVARARVGGRALRPHGGRGSGSGGRTRNGRRPAPPADLQLAGGAQARVGEMEVGIADVVPVLTSDYEDRRAGMGLGGGLRGDWGALRLRSREVLFGGHGGLWGEEGKEMIREGDQRLKGGQGVVLLRRQRVYGAEDYPWAEIREALRKVFGDRAGADASGGVVAS